MTTTHNNINYIIHFQFYVDDKNISSHAKNINNHIFINVNAFELFTIIQEATKDYFSILEYDKQLQSNCLNVWQAIKGYTREITSDESKNGEAQNLILAINKESCIYSFRKKTC